MDGVSYHGQWPGRMNAQIDAAFQAVGARAGNLVTLAYRTARDQELYPKAVFIRYLYLKNYPAPQSGTDKCGC